MYMRVLLERHARPREGGAFGPVYLTLTRRVECSKPRTNQLTVARANDSFRGWLTGDLLYELHVQIRTGVVRHQSLARDHLAYCDLTTDRQKRANDIVRAHHALTVSRVNRRNSALVDALRPAPNFAVGAWAWVYNSASIIRQGMYEGERRRQGTQGQTHA